MTDTPEPLTQANCDLRDFAYMPLDVVRLRDADIASIDAEAFRAAVISWCVAWHQVPAGSLPDDDVTLCRVLGYGRDLKGWKKLRAAGALRGYVKCSDGRLYHSVVAEKARESWQKKQAQRDRTESARVARLSQNRKPSVTEPVTEPVTDIVTVNHVRTVTASKVREGKGKEGKGREEDSDLRSGADAPPDARTILWQQGVPIIRQLIGQSESQARGFLGKMLKVSRDDCVSTLRVILEAQSLRPTNPAAWLLKAAVPLGERNLWNGTGPTPLNNAF